MAEVRVSQKPDLVKLVRHVAGRDVRRQEGGDDRTILLQRTGDAARPFGRAVFADACARGLLVLRNETVQATPQAMAFLRRAALAPEDRFQDQHRDVEKQSLLVDDVGQTVRVNLSESPLGGMARLKEKSGEPFLTAMALDAGLRLHADFTRAHLQPRLTMAYEPRLAGKTKGMAGGTADLCDSAVAARGRVRSAVEAIGPELSGVALDVCCFEKGLETVERERQWPVRSAKLMLRAALMALARHYAPPAGRGRTTAWGDDGFRPQMGDAMAGKLSSGG